MQDNGSRRHKLIAIDGNSLLYRAFFAMRHLSTADGQPTNAVYGFTMMLLRLLQEERPDSIVVAFDAPVKTFRHEEFEDYKAHRKPVPDELKSQAPIARQMVAAFNIPMIEIPGFEADDVVGTIAKQSCAVDYDALIVTGDLDALQLVNHCVKVMTTVKGVTDTVIYDEDAVINRFGIRPDQMADFKALKGDASDNIPGVPGVGDKTAAKLIKRFGSIESLYERLDEVEEQRIKGLLETAREQAVLSKMLATIVTDVPIEYTVEDFKTREPDYETLRSFFKELEFRTLLKRLPEPANAEVLEEKPKIELGECWVAETDKHVSALIAQVRNAGKTAIRIHTTNGKPTESEILGISFSTGPGETGYVRIAGSGASSLATGLLFDMEEKPFSVELLTFKYILESSDIQKFSHDLKNDIEALKLRGIKLCGLNFDTMIGAYVFNSTRSGYAIADVAFEQLGMELPKIDKSAKAPDSQPSVETVICAETEAIWRLVPVLLGKLHSDNLLKLAIEIEMPLISVLAEMELRGVAIDTDYLRQLSIHLNDQLRRLEQEIYQLAGHEFNIGSPKQLQTVLFEERQIPVGKKTKTGFSTDADTLESLASSHPIVAQILEWRELSKLKSTYADALPKLINPKTGRIHTSLNQAVTTTGRLSSSEPNLQNIPIRTGLGREIRKGFVATNDNLLLSIDYSQIELRIMAHVTGDEELVRAFTAREDIHTHTASTLFGIPESEVDSDKRRVAKTVNFAVIYGMSDFGLARELGIPTREAKEFIDRYFTRFPGVRNYTEETLEFAREKGYVTTLLGRRRYIPEILSGNRNFRMFAERSAVNMPIQGTAADMMKLAMIAVDEAIEKAGFKTQMVLQVHDELVFEMPPDEQEQVVPLVKNLMETAFEISVPVLVEVKVGKNWAEMERVG